MARGLSIGAEHDRHMESNERYVHDDVAENVANDADDIER